jgi:hypothetical protein
MRLKLHIVPGEAQELERDIIQLTLPSIHADRLLFLTFYDGPYHQTDGRCREGLDVLNSGGTKVILRKQRDNVP